MNIMELGALGEFVGALAVIITLIYLGLQVRQNTISSRAGTFANATDAWTDYLQAQSINDLDLMLRLATEPTELTHAEFLRVYYLYRALFRRMENDYYQYRNGVFDQGTWEAYVMSWERDMFSTPSCRAMWGLQRSTFGPQFCEVFDAVSARAARTPTPLRRQYIELLGAETAAAG